jgi:hypothetical protein
MLKGAKVIKLRNLRKSYDQKTVQNNFILFLFGFIHLFCTLAGALCMATSQAIGN